MKFEDNPALLIIDAQKGINEVAYWGGNRNNPEAEINIAALLNRWRLLELPVIIIQHRSLTLSSPLHPDHRGYDLMDFVKVRPNEKVVMKTTTSAFVQTNLQQHIEQNNISSIIIAGFVTNNSVESTARSAGDLGIKAIVVADATACFDKVGIDGKKYSSDMVHQLSLANINDEYASIFRTKDILQIVSNLKSQSKI